MSALANDPFSMVGDPRRYVSRPASKGALEQLHAALDQDSHSGVVVLAGPTGIGKSIMLHCLADARADRDRVVALVYPTLSRGALWQWLAEELGVGPKLAPRDAILDLAERCYVRGSSVVVLADEAASLPRSTLEDLIAACKATPGLRAVLAVTKESVLDPCLPGDTSYVRLDEPLSLAEADGYLKARLDFSGAPDELRAAFGPEVVAELHARSAGSPARLNVLAGAVVLDQLVGRRPSSGRAPHEEVVVTAPPPPTPSAATKRKLAKTRGRRRPFVAAVAVGLCLAIGLGFLAGQRWIGGTSEPAAAIAPVSEALVATTGAAVPEPDIVAVEPANPEPLAAPPTESPLTPALAVQPVTALASASGSVSPPTQLAEPAAPAEPAASAVPEGPRAEPVAPAPAATVPVAPPRGRIGALNINAVPWASIRIDGKPAGETPLGGLKLVPGPHKVVAVFPDAREEARQIEIDDQETFVVFR